MGLEKIAGINPVETVNLNEAPVQAEATPDVEVSAPAPAQAQAQATAPAKVDKDPFRAQGRSVRAQMSEDEKAIEGTASDTVKFICALGNPAKPQNRVEGDNKHIPSYAVCGYKFKALKDMTIPNVPQTGKGPLNVGACGEDIAIASGTIFSLNIVEAAVLASRVEFAGTFSGEGEVVKMEKKSSEKRQDKDMPYLPIFRKVNGGSIKSNMELIADVIGTGADKTYEVKPEYREKFGILFTKRVPGQPKDKEENLTTKEVAAAFRAMFKSTGRSK